MLLAVDTATPQVSVARRAAGRVVATERAVEGRRHGEILVPMIQRVLASGEPGAAGANPADLTVLAVDVGPGLFTGLRVGVATVKAMASALGLPAVGVTSLEVLARAAQVPAGPGSDAALVAAVVDARRHEVFRAVTRGGEELIAPGVVPPDVLARELAELGERVLAVGDGAARYADVLASPLVEVEAAYPDAAVLAELAAERVAVGEAGPASGLRAVYLRQADVRIGWARRDDPPPSTAAGPPSTAAAPPPSTAAGPPSTASGPPSTNGGPRKAASRA